MANRTCIGTTDTLVESPITEVTDEDRDFILSNINARLEQAKPLTRDDIISERCGVRPLAVSSQPNDDSHFLQLSRKHVIETDREQQHVSIFGGKLTDCINVGEEVCDSIAAFGIPLQPLQGKWYGEPDGAAKRSFFERAAQLGVDQMHAADTGEALSARLWRRYADKANAMLEQIAADPSMAEPVITGTGIRRCELTYLVQQEMIVRLEDLLRRRSKLEMLLSTDRLRHSEGLRQVCTELFGELAETKYQEYFADDNDVTVVADEAEKDAAVASQ